MRKALKVIDQSPAGGREQSGVGSEMELLVSHDPNRKSKGSSVASRVKLHSVLLAIGLIGSIGCSWTMFNTHESKARMQDLGLHKVANSLENILSLLAYPVLMFTVILSAYAAQQLYKLYRVANDPETYRKNRPRNPN